MFSNRRGRRKNIITAQFIYAEKLNPICVGMNTNFIFTSQVPLVRYFKIILWSCYLVFSLPHFLLNIAIPRGFFVPYN